MRVVTIPRFGGPEVLAIAERPDPVPQRGEVRVRIRATAVNRADLLQRMGTYPAPADAPPDVPGLELAGEVDAVGPGVDRLAIGDRVFGLVGGGAYAEAIVTHERALARIPAGLSWEEAAAIPEAYVTAHDALVTQAKLTGGESVLISAVGSGVGTAAVQIVRALGGISVGTARTADKLPRAQELGLDHGIVAEGSKFADAVKQVVPGGVHVVLELVGGSYLEEDLRCVRTRGRIALVGLMAGARTELDLGLILRGRVTIIGTVLRARPLEEKLAAMRAFEDQVVPLIARGALKPVVDRVFSLDEASAAHTYVAGNTGFGKVVLRV